MVPIFVLVFGLFGAAAALHEARAVEDELRADAELLAHALATMLAEEPFDYGPAAGRIDEIDRAVAPMLITLLPMDAAPRAAKPGRVVATAPVVVAGEQVARLIVEEPLPARQQVLRRALLWEAAGALVATLLGGLLASLVSRLVIERRVDLIVKRLQSVGRGELSGTPLDLGDDELGWIGAAVDQLAGALRLAKAQAREEAEARQAAWVLLRRADRLSAVGRTAAVFAHEVGTPLNVVMGRAERVVRRAESEASVADADIIRGQADRISSFVRRLLDYSRQTPAFEPKPLAVEPLLERVLGLLEEQARRREVSLSLDAWRERPARLLGDASALEQVFTNLVVNAIDASPPGGQVRVRVRGGACGQVISPRLPKDHLHVEVIDQGPGVPEALRARTFDPFFTTKPAGEGTGLGLAVALEIVSDHGGLITLGDAPDGGCLATVHLPLMPRIGGPHGR